jgi:triphosphoribosyl-dephospho-CoA synthetase
VAIEVSQRAATALARPQMIPEFDLSLRSPRRLNPGTTADLTAAALYILFRSGRLLTNFRTTASPDSPPARTQT